QQAQGFKVDGLQGANHGLHSLIAQVVVNQTHHQQRAADDAVDFRGQVPAVGSEGSADQQADGAQQQEGGNVVGNLGQGSGLGDLALFLPENPVDNAGRQHSAQLHGKEDGGLAEVPEEVHEAHVQSRAQHNGGGVTYQSRGALEVGGNGDGNENGDGIGFQLLADFQSHRRHHQHRCHVVHKG